MSTRISSRADFLSTHSVTREKTSVFPLIFWNPDLYFWKDTLKWRSRSTFVSIPKTLSACVCIWLFLSLLLIFTLLHWDIAFSRQQEAELIRNRKKTLMAQSKESVYDPDLHPQGLRWCHIKLQTFLLSSPSFSLLLLCSQRIELEFNSQNLALHN